MDSWDFEDLCETDEVVRARKFERKKERASFWLEYGNCAYSTKDLEKEYNFSPSEATRFVKENWVAGNLERKPKGGVWYYRPSSTSGVWLAVVGLLMILELMIASLAGLSFALAAIVIFFVTPLLGYLTSLHFDSKRKPELTKTFDLPAKCENV